MSYHFVSDPAMAVKFRETALLFGTPFVMLYTGGMGTGNTGLKKPKQWARSRSAAS